MSQVVEERSVLHYWLPLQDCKSGRLLVSLEFRYRMLASKGTFPRHFLHHPPPRQLPPLSAVQRYLYFPCRSVFQFPNVYSNTLVHSSPPPSAILYGKMSSITLFFSNEYNRHDTTFYALDIDRHFTFYFISYCIENRHLCETL
jgi:hypothetical protein